MSQRGSAGRRKATRLLAVVAELHKRGFQGLRIVPWLTEEPFGWVCHVLQVTDVHRGHGADGRVEMGSTILYDSRSGTYLWSSKPDATARELADELEHGSLSGWLQAARLDDFAYAGWFSRLLGMAERGYLPCLGSNGTRVPGDQPLPLFAWPDGTVPPGRHWLPPAPLPVRDVGARLRRCPDPDGPMQPIAQFALSYDGYGRIAAEAERILHLLRPVLEQVKRDGTVPPWAGLDVMRGALFYLQREAHFTEVSEPVNEREMRSLAREIALHVAGRPLPHDHAFGGDGQEPLTDGYGRRVAEHRRS